MNHEWHGEERTGVDPTDVISPFKFGGLPSADDDNVDHLWEKSIIGGGETI